MNRLSALDALFLYMETTETPMHVASVTIFKPASPQEDLFARFREHTAARLHLLPSSHRRIAPTPLGIDHPAWAVEEAIDLHYHIRHAALPTPGGMAELRALVAQLHALPLDRSRPLWEYHFIEGFEGGGFAVYAKTHHSAMDGIAGMATLDVIFDSSPDDDRDAVLRRVIPPDVEPTDFIELTSTAIGDFVRQGWRAVTSLPSAARTLAKVSPHFVRDARFLYKYVNDMPRTPFNRVISGRRVYATCSLPLAKVKALGKSRGVTVNDVVLALCAGSLRRYLTEHAALPDKPLAAGVPASLRAPGDAKLNNQVVFTLSSLPTDVADPLPRLAASQTAAQEAKNLFADMRNLVSTNISILGAPLAAMGFVRVWAGARGANYLKPFFNVVISNVPGPRQPMYCVGAPATHYFPVSIPYHGCALNITVQSYCDTLDFGLVACAETVPDAQSIADYVAEDFAAMEEAAAEAGPVEAPDTVAPLATLSARLSGGPKAGAPAPPEPPPAAKAPPPEPSPLSRTIEALGAATDALLRMLDEPRAAPARRRKTSPPAEPKTKTKAARGNATGSRAA